MKIPGLSFFFAKFPAMSCFFSRVIQFPGKFPVARHPGLTPYAPTRKLGAETTKPDVSTSGEKKNWDQNAR